MSISKNCVLCMEYIWLKFFPILGITGAFYSKCNHDKIGNRYVLKRSLIYFWIVCLTILTMTIITILDIFYFIERNDFTVYNVFILLTDTLLILNTMQFQIFFLVFTNERKIEYIALMKILNAKYAHGISTILSVKYINDFRKYSALSVILFVIAASVYTLFDLFNTEFDGWFSYLKSVIHIYSFCVDFLNMTTVGILFVIYKKIFTTAYGNIIETMTKRRDYLFQSCLVQIKKIHRLHSGVYFNFRIFVNCTSIQATVWTLLTVMAMVLNIYLAIGTNLHAGSVNFDTSYTLIKIRIACVSIALNLVAFFMGNLEKSVSLNKCDHSLSLNKNCKL